jgi:hypothetical protein
VLIFRPKRDASAIFRTDKSCVEAPAPQCCQRCLKRAKRGGCLLVDRPLGVARDIADGGIGEVDHPVLHALLPIETLSFFRYLFDAR